MKKELISQVLITFVKLYLWTVLLPFCLLGFLVGNDRYGMEFPA
jgi:hypothetical protein